MPDKTRVALQWAVRSGDNRFAYISRYKSFSGLANGSAIDPALRSCKVFPSRYKDVRSHPCSASQRAVLIGKIQKQIQAIYQDGKIRLYFYKAPKIKTLCTAEENVSSGRRIRQ
jgi:hypothetical protein